jgi:hypothetical protein
MGVKVISRKAGAKTFSRKPSAVVVFTPIGLIVTAIVVLPICDPRWKRAR